MGYRKIKLDCASVCSDARSRSQSCHCANLLIMLILRDKNSVLILCIIIVAVFFVQGSRTNIFFTCSNPGTSLGHFFLSSSNFSCFHFRSSLCSFLALSICYFFYFKNPIPLKVSAHQRNKNWSKPQKKIKVELTWDFVLYSWGGWKGPGWGGGGGAGGEY